MAIDGALMIKIYSALIGGLSKSDFAYTLDSEHNAFWDKLAAGMIANPLKPGQIHAIPHDIPDVDEGVYTYAVEKHGEPGRDADYARKHPKGRGGKGKGS